MNVIFSDVNDLLLLDDHCKVNYDLYLVYCYVLCLSVWTPGRLVPLL